MANSQIAPVNTVPIDSDESLLLSGVRQRIVQRLFSLAPGPSHGMNGVFNRQRQATTSAEWWNTTASEFINDYLTENLLGV